METLSLTMKGCKIWTFLRCFWLIDWLIDWFVFYAVSAVFQIFWWVSPTHPPSFVVTYVHRCREFGCMKLFSSLRGSAIYGISDSIDRSLDIDFAVLHRHFVTSFSEWNFLERAEGNRQSINHESPAFSSLALWFYIHVDFSCTKKTNFEFTGWV